ncbi:MAG: GNAT family N-acetyltransferase [Cyanobacteria bacterium P01_D01_bin.56]
MRMDIRKAIASDLPELAVLFRQTVLVNAPQYYTSEQTDIWASSPNNSDQFRQFIFGVHTFVATDNTGILGFAGISQDGHVASTYVRHDFLCRGIGSALMDMVLSYAHIHGMARLYAEASEFSLGLFKKFGFHVYDTEVVDRQGVQFYRHLVELNLAAHS